MSNGGNGGRCVRLTTYHPCSAERQEILGLNLPGTPLGHLDGLLWERPLPLPFTSLNDFFLLEKTIAVQLLSKFATFYRTAFLYVQHLSKLNETKKYTDKISTIKSGSVRVLDDNIKWVLIVLGNGTDRTTIIEKHQEGAVTAIPTVQR